MNQQPSLDDQFEPYAVDFSSGGGGGQQQHQGKRQQSQSQQQPTSISMPQNDYAHMQHHHQQQQTFHQQQQIEVPQMDLNSVDIDSLSLEQQHQLLMKLQQQQEQLQKQLQGTTPALGGSNNDLSSSTHTNNAVAGRSPGIFQQLSPQHSTSQSLPQQQQPSPAAMMSNNTAPGGVDLHIQATGMMPNAQIPQTGSAFPMQQQQQQQAAALQLQLLQFQQAQQQQLQQQQQQQAAALAVALANSAAEGQHTLINIACPGPNDVLCGRGGGANNHVGNVEFRALVAEHKRRYLSADKKEKPQVARDVVRMWREQDPPGRFLAQDKLASNPGLLGALPGGMVCFAGSGLWHDIGDKKAREKASQCLRERTPDVIPFIKELERKQKEEEEAKLSGDVKKEETSKSEGKEVENVGNEAETETANVENDGENSIEKKSEEDQTKENEKEDADPASSLSIDARTADVKAMPPPPPVSSSAGAQAKHENFPARPDATITTTEAAHFKRASVSSGVSDGSASRDQVASAVPTAAALLNDVFDDQSMRTAKTTDDHSIQILDNKARKAGAGGAGLESSSQLNSAGSLTIGDDSMMSLGTIGLYGSETAPEPEAAAPANGKPDPLSRRRASELTEFTTDSEVTAQATNVRKRSSLVERTVPVEAVPLANAEERARRKFEYNANMSGLTTEGMSLSGDSLLMMIAEEGHIKKESHEPEQVTTRPGLERNVSGLGMSSHGLPLDRPQDEGKESSSFHDSKVSFMSDITDLSGGVDSMDLKDMVEKATAEVAAEHAAQQRRDSSENK